MRTLKVSVCATDVAYFRGDIPAENWPLIPGHEYLGEVAEVGRKTSGVKKGDLLVYWGQTDFGGLAEWRCIRPVLAGTPGITSEFETNRYFQDDNRAAAVAVKEEDIESATLLEPLTSVLRAILHAPPRPGERCLILGAGPCGLMAAQVVKRVFGAANVAVVDVNRFRLDMASQLGADHVLDPQQDPDQLEKIARDSAPPSYVFDTLANLRHSDVVDTRRLAMRTLQPEARYVVYGATEIPQSIDTWLILAKGLRLSAAPFDVSAFPMERSAHVMGVALRLARSRLVDLEALVTHRIGFRGNADVQRVFNEFGAPGSLKTMISVAV